MFKRYIGMFLTFAFCTLLASRTAHASVLTVGSPAPALVVKRFVKGTPVSKFEKGKTYVVEFWATWCGPCKVSIPHLTELQKKFKDVTFIGVSVFEQTQTEVEPFVKSMGNKMDYHVALDYIPSGKSGQDGVMASSWMDASNQSLIPTAFVVNRSGIIAWIGSPTDLEEPLVKIESGKWDLKAAALEVAAKQQAQAALEDLSGKLGPLIDSKDYNGALVVINSALKSHPVLLQTLASVKLNVLISIGNDNDISAFAADLTDHEFQSNPERLSSLAWDLVNPDVTNKPGAASIAVGLRAAQQADRLSNGKDATIADILAAAYFARGNKTKAIAVEKRAIAECKDVTIGAELRKKLEKFEK